MTDRPSADPAEIPPVAPLPTKRRTKVLTTGSTAVAPAPYPIGTLANWAEYALKPLQQVPAPHHRLLLDYLERVTAGKIDRLLVLMPPGSAKSTYSSTIFPAWWFHHHPRSSVIAASHTADLSV